MLTEASTQHAREERMNEFGRGESVQLTRRRVTAALGGSALAGGGLLAVACGGPEGAGGSQAAKKDRAPVSIRVKTWTNIINIPTWEKAFKAFNDAHAADKLTVVLEHQPTDYDAKVTAEYAAGSAPDVIYQNPAPMQAMAVQGMVKDHSAEVKADKFNTADIAPGAQLPYMWEGKIYGLAAWSDTRVLSINVNAFKAAGIPLPPQTADAPGWTVDDFVAAARKLSDASSNKFAFVHEGVGSLKRFSWQWGAYYWNDDKVPTRSAFGTPENVSGLQWVRDLQYGHRVMASRTFANDFGGWEKMFPQGMMPIAYCAYKHVTAGWQEIKDFEWSIAPMPRMKTRMHHVSPQAFAMMSATKNPVDGWTVVKDFSVGEANAIMASVSSMPAYKKTDVYKVANIGQDKRWMIKLLQDSMGTGKPEVPHPNIRLEMLAAMDAVTTDLMDDKIGPAEAAKSGQDKVNALFDQFGLRK
jgi:multiple sugar transport system substrate-binding protein